MSRPYATDEQYERWFMARCCRCGRRQNKAGSWPDGYVCRTCSDRAVRSRGTCPGCGQDRVLPGLRPGDGAAICPACAGFSQTFDCTRCGLEGKLLGGRLCERCSFADRLAVLLDDGTGSVRPELAPGRLAGAMDNPQRAGLAVPAPWPAGNAAQMLRQLGLGQIPLTHDAFHQLQPWRTAAHLGELLMASGVLPAADKYICSFQRWLPGHLAGVADPGHAKRSGSSRPGTSFPGSAPERTGATSRRASAASPPGRSNTPPATSAGSPNRTAPWRPAARSTSTPGTPRTANTAAPA